MGDINLTVLKEVDWKFTHLVTREAPVPVPLHLKAVVPQMGRKTTAVVCVCLCESVCVCPHPKE